MILRMYSVRDSAANAFLTPFFAPTDGLAIRSFMDAINDANNPISKHFGDYTLYSLGDFDDANGDFTSEKEPLRLMTGLEAQMRVVS